MSQAGFFMAYENNPDITSDQLVFFDNSAQIFESWKFHYLTNFDRDILSTLPHLPDLHLVSELFVINELTGLFAN